MSQLREAEGALYDVIAGIAARTDSATGTADGGSIRTLRDVALSGTDWQWAVLTMTSGANEGRWRVVTGWDDASDTLTCLEAFPDPVAAGDTYSIAMAPLGGATVFLRRVIPRSMEAEELPAVFVAALRARRLVRGGAGAKQGSRFATLRVRMDALSAWELDDEETYREAADKLHEQLDQLRLGRASLGGAAKFADPDGDEPVSDYGELDSGQRVFWSTMQALLMYAA